MPLKNLKKRTLFLLLFMPLSLFANQKGGNTALEAKTKSKMEQAADKFFEVVHPNTGALFHNSETAGVVGPSGMLRTEVVNINPVNISLPSLKVGCGGIDYNLGALTIASGKQMKKALEGIAKAGVASALQLSMEAASPQLSSVVAKVQHWQNQLNSININSCEIASILVDTFAPKTERVSQTICQRNASRNIPFFKNRISAVHGCNSPKDEAEKTVQKKAVEKAHEEGLLVGDFNLAWEVLKDKEISDSFGMVANADFKNLYLNVSGTILSKDGKITVYTPQVEEALRALINGTALINAYKFNPKDPLDLQTKQEINVPKGEKQRVYDLLKEIRKKIVHERTGEFGNFSSWTAEEEALLKNSSFPFSGMMALMSQYGGDLISSHLDLAKCAEIIAFEGVSRYLKTVASTLLAYSREVEVKQLEDTKIRMFQESLEETLTLLRREEAKNVEEMNEKLQMITFLLNVDRNLKTPEGG